ILVRPWRCGKRAGRRVNPLLPVHLFSGASIVTGEESPIEQRVVVIPIYQRRRMVRAALRKRPGNKLVALLTLLERNVSGSTRADGKDRALLIAHITRRQIEKAEAGKRSWNSNRGHPAELPKQLPIQVVGSNLARSRGDDLYSRS